MVSASESENPIGFSTSTGLPSLSACRIGVVCCSSGADDHRGHVRVRDDFLVAAGVEIGTGQLR